ncbi:unnamed protein product, partial [Scytosiphon promiscuus]
EKAEEREQPKSPEHLRLFADVITLHEGTSKKRSARLGRPRFRSRRPLLLVYTRKERQGGRSERSSPLLCRACQRDKLMADAFVSENCVQGSLRSSRRRLLSFFSGTLGCS